MRGPVLLNRRPPGSGIRPVSRRRGTPVSDDDARDRRSGGRAAARRGCVVAVSLVGAAVPRTAESGLALGCECQEARPNALCQWRLVVVALGDVLPGSWSTVAWRGQGWPESAVL